MSGFNFERHLPHQSSAIDSILKVFSDAYLTNTDDDNINPSIRLDDTTYLANISQIQKDNHIPTIYQNKPNSNIIDISMETGTGKTYTYTKSIFALNQKLGIFKFIIIVPTVPIKAGTCSFIKSSASKEHFRQEFDKNIKLYVINSINNKKYQAPTEVYEFLKASSMDKKTIHVMLINSGMVNSEKFSQENDELQLDGDYRCLFDAIAMTKPIVIIDEPHKFKLSNKTWQNIKKFKPQYIFRYGATFEGKYEHLIYSLSAVDAFNQNLIKGVVVHKTDFKDGYNTKIQLLSCNNGIVKWQLITPNDKIKEFDLNKGDSLEVIHPCLSGITISHVGVSKTEAELSNGLILNTKNNTISPYAYSNTLQDEMIKATLDNHFKLEAELMTRDVRIKPITLFFISDIDSYRGDNPYLKVQFERELKARLEYYIKNEQNSSYRDYLIKSLNNLSLCHGGYFSRDNIGADDKIEAEINEILHDKELLLDVNNPRRFIFSKWTLKEGWDNPNVFQICKLRTSGSDTSKLQEVGRGLRLPVNEYMNRIANEQFYLHYFVDFTEEKFVDLLVGEINNKTVESSIITDSHYILEVLPYIQKLYPKWSDEEELLDYLHQQNVITGRMNKYTPNGKKLLEELFPLLGQSKLLPNKVTTLNKTKKATIRVAKYDELKHLWEKINRRAILQYKFEGNQDFYHMLYDYLSEEIKTSGFKNQGIAQTNSKIYVEQNQVRAKVEESINDEVLVYSTMEYQEFITILSSELHMDVLTTHKCLYDLRENYNFNIGNYMSDEMIRYIKYNFTQYLLKNSFGKFNISYDDISNQVHPTKLTYKSGKVKSEINSSDIGVNYDDNTKVDDKYLFEQLFYDSELEKANIISVPVEVLVFTKIPKNSIKIPVSGGGSYSPDFAYVIKQGDKESLHLIVETKGKNINQLSNEEDKKIKHAEVFFNNLINNSNLDVKIKYVSQYVQDSIIDIIKKSITGIE
jgi:type III restriction enzyme